MSSALLVFALYINQIIHPKMFPTSHLTKMREKHGWFINDITGLVGICLLPEPDDSTDDVSNESSEEEDSDKIIIVFCAIQTQSYSLIASIRTRSSSLIV